MKLIKHIFRKLEKTETEIEVIETWCVKWISLTKEYDWLNNGVGQINVQGFPSKKMADEYADELRSARKLLGEKKWKIDVYMQELNTNL